MTKYIKIMVVASVLVAPMACNTKNEEEIGPQSTVVHSAERIGVTYQKNIKNAYKYASKDVFISNTSWAPPAVFKVPSEIELKYNSEKQREVTSAISSSICTKAEIEVLMSEVCIEAKNTLKESISQVATVTRKEKLAAYQQARLAVYVRYEYFTGTLVVVPFNGYGPGSIAPMEYPVYWKIPKYTYVNIEKRTVK